jgi:hypothetical protein
MVRRLARWFLGPVLLATLSAGRGDCLSIPSPLDVVRRFCQADGVGHRVHPQQWQAVAPWVSWTLEPAWDRVLIISGYQIHPPRYFPDHVEIVVEYTVTQAVEAGQTDDTETAQQIEAITLRLENDEAGQWRITGPPPTPHLFASQLDVTAIRASLQPTAADYLSNSAFVWRMLTDAGAATTYRPVSRLRELFGPVDEPTAGDVALFSAGNVPYHVGLVTADNLIASATLNAGVMQTSPDMFSGMVSYLRLPQPLTAAPTPPAPPDLAYSELMPLPAPTPRATATPQPKSRSRAHPTKRPTRTTRSKKPRRRPTTPPHRRSVPRATPTRPAR